MTDWTFLSYELARHGIASDVDETYTEDYTPDPWRPSPEAEAVTVTLDLDDATKLARLLNDAFLSMVGSGL